MPKKIIFTIVALILFSCTNFIYKTKIVNIDGENIEIVLSTDNEPVWGLYMNITGKITGEIQLEVERCDSDFTYIYNYADNVNFNHSSFEDKPADYYSNKVIIRIYPKDNSKGKLKIKYYFGTL